MSHTIFLVEDEASIAQTLIYTLESEGFTVQWFDRAEKTLQALSHDIPDFLILDVGLPDINGFALWRHIQAMGISIPMMFLTARTEEIDRIVGLEMGADDYVAKPFSPREVSARVRTILRRVHGTQHHQTTIESTPADNLATASNHDFQLNEDKATIVFQQQLLSLTRYEYLLLKTLIKQPERVFSREQLLQLVWVNAEETLDRTVDTHIKTLRAKLRLIDENTEVIRTHRGLGYSLRCEPCA
jgi:two-component system catabolic regulation response regulator CreB